MNLKNITLTVTASLITIFISACGGTKVSMLTQPKHSLIGNGGTTETSNMKIFLQSGENGSISKALQHSLHDVVTDVITASGSEVVDRARAGKLIDELNLSSLDDDNVEAYEGPEVADFVIISTLKKSTVSSNYSARRTRTDKKGKSHIVEAYCSYSAKVKGTIDIRKLPSLKRVSLLNISGKGSARDSDYINRKCNKQNMMAAVTDEAVTKTFVKGTSPYLNLTNYVGAKAYITGARKSEGKVYLETNLGRSLGATEGAHVIIYQIIEGELVKVTEAEFLGDNNIYADRAFLTIDKDDLGKVKSGMIVKISGDCTGFGCLGKYSKSLGL